MSIENIKNKLKSLTQGSKSDSVLTNMSRTFKALSDYADWDESIEKKAQPIQSKTEEKPQEVKLPKTENIGIPLPQTNGIGLHYNIQIHLPPSRDPAVYDAIFESLKKHILNG